jgi:methylated-DNA-protein-cysteine methyltransferase-like protein
VPRRNIDQILSDVRRIPPGYVRTYGDLAPGAPRHAGAALSRCEDPAIPWWRVVRSDGSLAKGAKQARLLRDEGILVRNNRVDLQRVRLDVLDA